MSDLLFVELGAIVTRVLGPTRCTVEPFCEPRPPTFAAERGIELDFAESLASAIDQGAPAQARYDQFVGPLDAEGRLAGSPPVGPSFPGAAYEGVVRIREDVVRAHPALAAAAAALPGRPWEYQVVASIDERTGAVRRYHGFHAELVRRERDALVLRVAHAGASAEPRWSPREVVYDRADTERFYAGALVADRLVGGGAEPRRAGAVYIALAAATREYRLELPKLPPGAGL